MTIQFNHSPFRLLTEAEAEEIRGGQDSEIVVVGRRYGGGGTYFGGYADYGSGLEPHPTLAPADEGGGGYESPPPLDCRDTSLMTPQELRDYRISQVAAKIASDIMGKGDKDVREYGAYIIRLADGTFTHLLVTQGEPTFVAISEEGMGNWGRVVAMVHSHTGAVYVESDPNAKKFPTANASSPTGEGDWFVFDDRVTRIRASLVNDHGMSLSEADAEVAQFRQYVLGPSGKMGSGQYELHGFDTKDRDRDTLGQKISPNLHLCP